MDSKKLMCVIESILFVAGEPVNVADLAHALDMTVDEINPVIDDLKNQYENEGHGLRLNRFGMSIQLCTRPEFAPYIERMLQPVQKQTLTQAAMETLSIIAYRQPITRAEIEAIRGVKCDYSVQSLMGKGLICEAGRRESLGRPMQYITTDSFLSHFGIESLEDLPPLNVEQELPEQQV